MNTANKKNKSRHATAAVMVLALGAAIYLNWSFARQAPEELTAEVQDPAVQETAAAATAVFDPLETDAAETFTEETPAQEANKNYGEAQLVSVSEDTGTEFFESARLNREKSRDEALDTIEKTLKSASLSDEEKQTATETLQAQITNIELEAELETLIKAKGFVDCVVMLGADTADVTVMTENDALTAAEVTQIRDVILSKCPDVKAQGITVVEVR